ncbi:MAG: DUF4268 domain-containing protein [Synergistaceae bacterium]|nr:DUF4268 domain-containing protein [Synergistaceae bacterium]
MVTLGRLDEIEDVHTVWHDEKKDFTEWLAKNENMQILSDAVGINIAVEEVNNYILASEIGTNRKIFIGSQLTETSSEYLGNLITHAAAKNAGIIIYIVKRALTEHKAAVSWLNSHSDDETEFYLCDVKLYAVGGSASAIRINTLVKPGTKIKDDKANHESIINLEDLRFEYWEKFQDYAFSDDVSNKKFAGSYKRWKSSSHYGVVFGIGRPGCSIQVTRMPDEIETGLYIADDKSLFMYLLGRKDEIEAETGLNFSWLELSDGKACRISVKKSPARLTDKEDWPEQFDWIIDTVLREKETFTKFIREYIND